MKIILTTLEGNIYPVEVSSDLELINLKALCEQETNISSNQMSLTHDGRPLSDDNKTLASYNIKDNDIVMVQHIVGSNLPLIDFSSISIPSQLTQSQSQRPRSSRTTLNPLASAVPNTDGLRNMLMSDPAQFELLKQRFPQLADAIQRNDTAKTMQLMEQLRNSDILQPSGGGSINPFDLEAQKRIAENIRLQNIQQNMEHALEYMPEAFGNVVMLYIDCQVNGHHVKAFVDSGAQMTIMSSACAERCGIMRLVDTRWAGIAKGVGTQKIVGRVHLAQIQIEKSFLTTAFSILEQQPMDMLLGLDILRRHQCIIDLQQNVLIFKSANIQTRFLSEAELPAFARLNHTEEADVVMEPQSTTSSNKDSKATPSSLSSGSAEPSEKSINNLLAMGFNRADIVDALKSSNGDENSAKIKLLAKALASPPKK